MSLKSNHSSVPFLKRMQGDSKYILRWFAENIDADKYNTYVHDYLRFN